MRFHSVTKDDKGRTVIRTIWIFVFLKPRRQSYILIAGRWLSLPDYLIVPDEIQEQLNIWEIAFK